MPFFAKICMSSSVQFFSSLLYFITPPPRLPFVFQFQLFCSVNKVFMLSLMRFFNAFLLVHFQLNLPLHKLKLPPATLFPSPCATSTFNSLEFSNCQRAVAIAIPIMARNI